MNNPTDSKTELELAISRLTVHNHLCLIYKTQEEQFAAVFPFIKAGLERGEKCVYIADDNTAEAIFTGMLAAGLDVKAALVAGKLAIVSKQETYLKEEYFDPDRMIAFLRRATDEAKAMGFSALRVTGEMTWVLGGDPGVERLMEYEAKLNYFLPENDALAVCQYNYNRFSPEVIKDVLSTHPLVIYGGGVYKNYNYIPPDEFLGSKNPAKEVDRFLACLISRAEAEAALQHSEARYLAIIEDQTELICRYLPDGRLSFVNEAYLDYFGKRSQDILGKNFIPHIPEPDISKVKKRVKGITPETPIIDFQHRVIMPDGAVRFQRWTHRGIYSPDGCLIEYQGVGRDITEKENAELVFKVRARILEHSFKYPLDQFLQKTLDEIESVCQSKCSFFHLVNADQSTLLLQAWSTSTLEICKIKEYDTHYSFVKAGRWADCIKLRAAVIHNDYPSLQQRRGLPAGHARIIRELVVPVFRNDKFVAILGLANKESDYHDSDAALVTQVANLAWDIAERKLAETQIQNSLREKEILLKEIHHRVKNNLQVVCSLLNLQAKKNVNPEVRAILESSRDRVFSMALVHKELYQSPDLTHVSFKHYLQSLLVEIAATYKQPHIKLSVEMADIAMDLNVAIPCGLIVNELVSNCFKHAFPGERAGTIQVGLKRNQDFFVLTVTDNGVGYPPDTDFSGTSSLGLQLVNVLAKQINGTIEYSRAEGSCFCVTLPATSQ
ncbi:MAG: MEDS domain-containing protein [Candidatus Riflebacteria bacterium]|nr:MEDS domain-containing protein [Candidatus Riflebacteria bacterium]